MKPMRFPRRVPWLIVFFIVIGPLLFSIGNVHAPETTGKFIAATFEHDTARPVDGYAAPQLHTHAVIFNVTERDNGQTRALQERSLFQSQQYATQRVPLRACHAAAWLGLRDRTRQARPAGDQGLHAGISRCIESAPGTDQRASTRDRQRRCGCGTGRRSPDER